MRKTVPLAAAAISIFLGTQQPAQAVDFDEILRTILTTVNTGTSPYSVSTVQNSVDNRQAELRNQISDGVTTGQLTIDEAADLRNRLASIADLEASYLTDGTLSYSETSTLLSNLTEVSRRLELYLTNASTTGQDYATDHSGWFSRFGARALPNGRLPNADLRLAHINTHQAELSAKIEQAALDGRLSWSEAKNLRQRLNKIHTDKTNYLADGSLSYNEEQSLRDALTTLDTTTRKEIEDSNRRSRYSQNRHRTAPRRASKAIDTRQSILGRRIDNGVKSGKLTRAEANRLYEQEQKINEFEAQLRSSGNKLTWREEQTLLNSMERLTKEVDRQLNDWQVR